jgi:hypothetical protein
MIGHARIEQEYAMNFSYLRGLATTPVTASWSVTDARLWHPWLRINRVMRVMLHTRAATTGSRRSQYEIWNLSTSSR